VTGRKPGRKGSAFDAERWRRTCARKRARHASHATRSQGTSCERPTRSLLRSCYRPTALWARAGAGGVIRSRSRIRPSCLTQFRERPKDAYQSLAQWVGVLPPDAPVVSVSHLRKVLRRNFQSGAFRTR
jgi:hypothetical protein